MGLSDLFSKSGREMLKARYDYERCASLRKATLKSFRDRATHDILFRYPDARLLLNSIDPHLMLLLKSQGRLQVGMFTDQYFPRLEFVGQYAATEELVTAVASFEHDVRTCSGFIAQSRRDRFEALSRWLSDVTTFQHKGYALTGTAELQYLIGGALFLNGQRIAVASLWHPKPRGYFSEKILELFENRQRRTGTQKLTFITADCNPIMEGQKMGYSIYFDHSLLALDPQIRREFVSNVVSLRDFIYEIEEFFNPACGLCDEDRLEYTPDSFEDELSSEDLNYDQSIESRYMFML